MKKAMIGVWAVLSLMVAATADATERYVVPQGTPGANPVSPYTSWADAATNVADIGAVLANGDRVVLSNGVHLLTAVISIPGKVNVEYVGVTGNPDDVIISGGGVRECFDIQGGSDILLASLTVSNGYSLSASRIGAGISVYTTPNVTISNCVITKNVSEEGCAGITVRGGSPGFRMIDCKVTDNLAATNYYYALGAGVYIENGIFASNCVFSGNSNSAGSAFGGGVFVNSGSPTSYFYKCSFSNNYCGGGSSGGAGGCNWSPVVLDNCTVENNYSGNSGGGWMVDKSDSILVVTNNCVFRDNRAPNGWGGGIGVWQTAAALTVVGATFERNAGSCGGAVGCYGSANGRGTILNSVLKNNSSALGGGVGVYPGANGNSMLIRNCLIVSNNASHGYWQYGGGGVVFLTGNGTDRTNIVESCTVAYNTTASYGGGIAFQGPDNANICLNSIVVANTAYGPSKDVYSAGTLTLSNSCTSLEVLNQGNTTNDPKFVTSQAVDGDFHLLKGSPCKDTGMNMDWMTDSGDLDGKPRIYNTTVDMGSYEFSSKGVGTVMVVK